MIEDFITEEACFKLLLEPLSAGETPQNMLEMRISRMDGTYSYSRESIVRSQIKRVSIRRAGDQWEVVLTYYLETDPAKRGDPEQHVLGTTDDCEAAARWAGAVNRLYYVANYGATEAV